MAAAGDPHQGTDDGGAGAGAVSEDPAGGGSEVGEIQATQEQQGGRNPGGQLAPSL